MADDDDEQDRRRAERIPINLEFASMPSGIYISDLSEYGVFVHTDTPAAIGSKLRLRFTVLLDDPVVITAQGWVVRHQQEPSVGMGIEFTDLDPETILRINDVVSRQRPRDSGPPLPRSDEGEAPSFQAPPSAGDGHEEIDEGQKTGLFRSVDGDGTPEDPEQAS